MQRAKNHNRDSYEESPKNPYGQHIEAYKPYMRDEFFIDDTLDVWSTEDGTFVASHDDVLRNYHSSIKAPRSLRKAISTMIPSAVQLELFPGFS